MQSIYQNNNIQQSQLIQDPLVQLVVQGQDISIDTNNVQIINDLNQDAYEQIHSLQLKILDLRDEITKLRKQKVDAKNRHDQEMKMLKECQINLQRLIVVEQNSSRLNKTKQIISKILNYHQQRFNKKNENQHNILRQINQSSDYNNFWNQSIQENSSLNQPSINNLSSITEANRQINKKLQISTIVEQSYPLLQEFCKNNSIFVKRLHNNLFYQLNFTSGFISIKQDNRVYDEIQQEQYIEKIFSDYDKLERARQFVVSLTVNQKISQQVLSKRQLFFKKLNIFNLKYQYQISISYLETNNFYLNLKQLNLLTLCLTNTITDQLFVTKFSNNIKINVYFHYIQEKALNTFKKAQFIYIRQVSQFTLRTIQHAEQNIVAKLNKQTKVFMFQKQLIPLEFKQNQSQLKQKIKFMNRFQLLNTQNAIQLKNINGIFLIKRFKQLFYQLTIGNNFNQKSFFSQFFNFPWFQIAYIKFDKYTSNPKIIKTFLKYKKNFKNLSQIALDFQSIFSLRQINFKDFKSLRTIRFYGKINQSWKKQQENKNSKNSWINKIVDPQTEESFPQSTPLQRSLQQYQNEFENFKNKYLTYNLFYPLKSGNRRTIKLI